MADILDRTVTITLKAVNDAYNSAITAAAKTTDDAISSINTSVASASKGFDSLSTSVTATGQVAGGTTQSTIALSNALDTANKALASNATASAQAATASNAITQSGTAAAVAEKSVADNAAKATDAVKVQSLAAAETAIRVSAAGDALKSTGEKASEAGSKVKEAGEKTSLAGSFIDTLKEKALQSIPGLGGLANIAGGVASGLAGFQIAQAAAEWIFDVGKKALESSGQLTAVSKVVGEIQESIEGLIGRAIQGLFGALAALAPLFNPIIDGIEQAIKWLSALGDWFSKSGTASAVFKSVLTALTGLFQPVIDALESFWQTIMEVFGNIQKFLAEHPAVWQAMLAGVVIMITNLVAEIRLAFAIIGVLFRGFVDLVQGEWKLITDIFNVAASAIGWVWSKLTAGVQAIGDVFRTIFTALPGPVQDAFKAVANTILDWVTKIIGFVGDLVSKIPGLKEYRETFDSISGGLVSWTQKIAGGTAAQKAANDAAEEAKKKAQELAKAQEQVGIMTKDATDKAVAGALAMASTFDKLRDSGTESLAALAVAAKNTYTNLVDAQTKTAATATDAQKRSITEQISAIQQWANAHHVALTDAVADTADLVEETQKLDPFLVALTARYQALGLATRGAVIDLANQSQLAWETFTTRQQHTAAESAAFIQAQYANLEKQVDAARAAGYANEVARLESMQAQVAAMAAASGIKLKAVSDAFDAITKSIDAIVPASDDATRAIVAMEDKSLDASKAMADGMDLVTARTDVAVQKQLDAISNGYAQQVAIAGTSLETQARLAQDYYAKLKDAIGQSGDTWTQAQKAQAQATMDAMKTATDAVHVGLDKSKKDTEDATEEMSQWWQNFGKAAEKAMKQAASAMADAIVNGNTSFGELCKKMLKDLEKAFIQTFLNTALNAVTGFIQKAFTDKGGLFDIFSSAAKAVTSLGKSVGDSLPMMQIPGATSIPGLGSSGGGSAAGGAGGALSSLGGALGSIGGAINVVSSAVSAITGIISIFQMRGQTKVLENIQDMLILIYGQLLSVVAPTLQSGLMSIANYQLHFFDTWFWKWVDYLGRWADRAFSATQAAGANSVAAIQAGAAAIVQALQTLTLKDANADVLVAAVTTAGSNTVQAIQAGAAATVAVLKGVAGAPATVSLDPLTGALKDAAASIVAAIGKAATGTVEAIRGIGTLPSDVTGEVTTNLDLSPVTNLLAAVRDALTQGSLRPNVVLNVDSAPSAQDVAQTIVRQLQLQGVIR